MLTHIHTYRFIIKRLLISLAVGGVLTWLTYAYCRIPSTGPRLISIVFLVPMQLVATAIAKDRHLQEVVYWSLLVVFYSVCVFLVVGYQRSVERVQRAKKIEPPGR